MILPIGDQPNPRGTPIVTYAIIALNVAVFVMVSLPLTTQPADPDSPLYREYVEIIGRNLPAGAPVEQILQRVSAYDLFVFQYGYRPSDPSLVTLFTSIFLHGGLAHLFGNMLFLWIYGDNVEHRLGSTRFAAWYLITGVAASLFHSVFAAGSPLPMVGASGAISGVLGFYFLWFPHNQVRLWVVLFPFFMNVLLVPARLVLGFYLVIDNLLPFLVTRGGGGSGVAYGAHIGGFLAGLAAAWVKNRRQMTSRPAEYGAAAFQAGKPSRSPAEAIAGEIRSGRFEDAAELYFELPAERTRRLLSCDDSIALGNWLAKNGHARAALTVYQRHIRDFPRGPGLAEAHAYAGLIQLHAFDEPTAAYQHLVEALEHNPSSELESMVRKALSTIAERQKFPVKRYRR